MNAPPLNPDEYGKFAHAMGARLLEHFSGLCILGFHATTGQPIIYCHAEDVKTRMAMTDLLRVALSQNAVINMPVVQQPSPPPDEAAPT